jgi:hypothetical protein
MKKTLLLLALLAPAAFAQWIVNDPINTVINTGIQSAQIANHVEILRQWATQLEALNRQIREMQDQLAVQRRIRDVLGDPTAAGAQVVLRDLGATDLSRSYGETMQAVQRLANAASSLRRTAEGIFTSLDDRTVLNREFTRQEPRYRRYATVERQADNYATVLAETEPRTVALQTDVANTLAAMRAAPTQAEVDKLGVKVAALNGQLAQLAARRRDEAEKLQAQQILNENQAAKERQDLLEKQIAEERHTLGIVNAWQQSVQITPTTYTRP